MRPTRAGLGALIGGPALLVLGRVLGMVELSMAGLTICALAVGSWLWVLLRPCRVSVRRTVHPARVHVGSDCTVGVEVENHGTGDAPVLRVHDPVTGTPGAGIGFASIPPGETGSARYRLPTQRRGLVVVGPATVSVGDPFGLFSRLIPAAERLEVTVLPHVDVIPPLPRTMGADPDGTTDAGGLGRGGEDFASLRPYVVGDDLRRVHWLTSARRDELLVRQHDVPRHGRICVLLDLRPQVGGSRALEPAVSAAASILRAHLVRGDHARLVTTHGTDSGYGTGQVHLDLVLGILATVTLTPGSLRSAIATLGARGSGALVVVSRMPVPSDLEQLSAAAPNMDRRRLVRFDGRGDDRTEPVHAAGLEQLSIGPDEAFDQRWRQATESTGRTGSRTTGRAPSPGRIDTHGRVVP